MQVTEKIEAQLKDRLPEVSGAVCLTISALTGQGLEGILPTAVHSYAVWNQRITTGRLNSWLAQVNLLTIEPLKPKPHLARHHSQEEIFMLSPYRNRHGSLIPIFYRTLTIPARFSVLFCLQQRNKELDKPGYFSKALFDTSGSQAILYWGRSHADSAGQVCHPDWSKTSEICGFPVWFPAVPGLSLQVLLQFLEGGVWF